MRPSSSEQHPSAPPRDETPAQRVARQLEALMKRHQISSDADFVRLQERRLGPDRVVPAPTIGRLRKASAKTEPEKVTLRRLAHACGETLEQAFPEAIVEQAPTIVIGGQRIAVVAKDGQVISPSVVERIQNAIDQSEPQPLRRK